MIKEEVKYLTKGSHSKVTVTCDFGVSDKCRGQYNYPYKDALRFRNNNEGKDICLFCSRTLKFSGRKNPNMKYPLDDTLFSVIDTHEKAYVLGLIASDGSIGKGAVNISLKESDESSYNLLTSIANWSQCGPVISKKNKDICGLTFNSTQIASDVITHLGLGSHGKKCFGIKFPLLSPELTLSFVAGFFDGDGCVTQDKEFYNYPRCSFASGSLEFLESLQAFLGVSSSLSKGACCHLEYAGSNALDILGRIYSNTSFKLERKYTLFRRLAAWLPSFGPGTTLATFKCVRTSSEAKIPSKTNISDSGYDITIISKLKTVGDVEFFDTGIKIQPTPGWWLALVPRSSISKTGYILANNLGVIDQSYTGNIIVALRKVDKLAPDLELPLKIAQIVPMPASHFEIEEVDSLEVTNRGTGGFGSTGN